MLSGLPDQRDAASGTVIISAISGTPGSARPRSPCTGTSDNGSLPGRAAACEPARISIRLARRGRPDGSLTGSACFGTGFRPTPETHAKSHRSLLAGERTLLVLDNACEAEPARLAKANSHPGGTPAEGPIHPPDGLLSDLAQCLPATAWLRSAPAPGGMALLAPPIANFLEP
jgi:hypothetical protein